jgi:hypothetical protein
MATSFPIEAGQVLAFARAVGDQDASAASAGEPAPPTFTSCSVQHDPAHMKGMRPAGALGHATTLSGTVLHAEQHFEYLAPVRVGDVLTVSESPGRTWEKTGRAGATLSFSELVKEVRDPSGELVVRARMVLVAVREQGPDA